MGNFPISFISGLLIAVGVAVSAYAEPSTAWQLNQHNPILLPGSLGAWDDFKVGSPSVLYENGEYRMWYRGCHFVGSDYGCAIGIATSKDGSEWIKSPDPVLLIDDPSERKGLHTLSVLKHAGQFLMYYSVSADPFKGRPFARIYLATSPDGRAWKKEGAVLRAIHKETFSIALTALHDGTLFHLWYVDSPHAKGVPSLLHVSSIDGKGWNVAGSTGLKELRLAHRGPGTSRIAILKASTGSFLGYSPLSEEHFRFLNSHDGTEWSAADGGEIVLPKGSTLEAPFFVESSNGVATWFVMKSESGAESIGSAFHSGGFFQ